MKKIMSIICITILLFLNLINVTYANVNVNLKAPTMAAKDQEFKIILESDAELLGTNFVLIFDETQLEYVRIEGETSDEETTNQTNNLNLADLNAPGRLNVAIINTEPIEQQYAVIFKPLQDEKTATIQVEYLDLLVKDETAENGIRKEANIKIEDLKIKLVNESELVEGEQTVGRSNSLLIYIIIGVVVVVVIIVIVLLVLKKKKKK